MIWIYILLFVIIALIVYLIYLVRFWGRTNIELTGDTYVSPSVFRMRKKSW